MSALRCTGIVLAVVTVGAAVGLAFFGLSQALNIPNHVLNHVPNSPIYTPVDSETAALNQQVVDMATDNGFNVVLVMQDSMVLLNFGGDCLGRYTYRPFLNQAFVTISNTYSTIYEGADTGHISAKNAELTAALEKAGCTA